jgi:hypothetical protein
MNTVNRIVPNILPEKFASQLSTIYYQRGFQPDYFVTSYLFLKKVNS